MIDGTLMSLITRAIQRIVLSELKGQSDKLATLTDDVSVSVSYLKADIDELKKNQDKISQKTMISILIVVGIMFFVFGFLSALMVII